MENYKIESKMIYNYTKKGKKPARDWSKIDWWGKSTSQLAKELNMRKSSISRLRRKHAPATIDKSNKSKLTKNVDWFMVDWSKKTGDIAKELGFHQSYISQKRRKFAPQTLKKRNFNNF